MYRSGNCGTVSATEILCCPNCGSRIETHKEVKQSNATPSHGLAYGALSAFLITVAYLVYLGTTFNPVPFSLLAASYFILILAAAPLAIHYLRKSRNHGIKWTWRYVLGALAFLVPVLILLSLFFLLMLLAVVGAAAAGY